MQHREGAIENWRQAQRYGGCLTCSRSTLSPSSRCTSASPTARSNRKYLMSSDNGSTWGRMGFPLGASTVVSATPTTCWTVACSHPATSASCEGERGRGGWGDGAGTAERMQRLTPDLQHGESCRDPVELQLHEPGVLHPLPTQHLREPMAVQLEPPASNVAQLWGGPWYP